MFVRNFFLHTKQILSSSTSLSDVFLLSSWRYQHSSELKLYSPFMKYLIILWLMRSWKLLNSALHVNQSNTPTCPSLCLWFTGLWLCDISQWFISINLVHAWTLQSSQFHSTLCLIFMFVLKSSFVTKSSWHLLQ